MKTNLLSIIILLFICHSKVSDAQIISSLALSVQLNAPSDVKLDKHGNIYIADASNSVIRKIDAVTNAISIVAGNGSTLHVGDTIAATSTGLDNPYSIALDKFDNLYISDLNHSRIRKVDAVTGIITTIAGNGVQGYGGDGGLAINAQIKTAYGIAVDDNGDLYISDCGNQRVRKVTVSTGIITTIAGNGVNKYDGDSGLAVLATVNNPIGITVDLAGNVIFVEGGTRIRKIDASTGKIYTIAGTVTTGFAGDGGLATVAQFKGLHGITLDKIGNLYVSDKVNYRIRKIIASSGIINTIAGNGTGGFSGDGGLPTNAKFGYVYGVAVDSVDNIYLADVSNNNIRKITYSTSSSIINEEKNIHLSYYPNPTNGQLNFDANDDLKEIKIAVTDMSGRVVKEFDNIQSKQFQISIGDLTNGLYFIHVISGNYNINYKVLKN